MQMLSPNSAAILSRLSEPERATVAERMVRIERLTTKRHQQDADLIDSLLRILSSANPQARKIRQLIKDIADDRA
jgi:hypothetical protein